MYQRNQQLERRLRKRGLRRCQHTYTPTRGGEESLDPSRLERMSPQKYKPLPGHVAFDKYPVKGQSPPVSSSLPSLFPHFP